MVKAHRTVQTKQNKITLCTLKIKLHQSSHLLLKHFARFPTTYWRESKVLSQMSKARLLSESTLYPSVLPLQLQLAETSGLQASGPLFMLFPLPGILLPWQTPIRFPKCGSNVTSLDSPPKVSSTEVGSTEMQSAARAGRLMWFNVQYLTRWWPNYILDQSVYIPKGLSCGKSKRGKEHLSSFS